MATRVETTAAFLTDPPRSAQPMFSNRTAWQLDDNRLARALAERRARDLPVLDLTVSNPTAVGLDGAGPEALAALSDRRGLIYQPDPRGTAAARAAVVRYYRERGALVTADRVFLTASTSEAYSLLFKLLADSGDTVLAPRPSYPLFAYLAGLDGVRLTPYRLGYDGGWQLQPSDLAAAADRRTRAVLAVNPNNPTGNLLERNALAALDQVAGARGWAVVADEVFADFRFTGDGDESAPPVAATAARAALTFSLSGVSKVCGLPQMKLAWIVLGGPDDLVAAAAARLEVIADTYLSVATPAQLALPTWLAGRGRFQQACRQRLRRNRALVEVRLADLASVELLAADAGWYAVVRVPQAGSDEALAVALLAEDGVLVHPGYFYDFERGAHLVVSLIVPPETLARGLDRIRARVSAGWPIPCVDE